MNETHCPAPALTALDLPWLSELSRNGALRELCRMQSEPLHLVNPRVFATTIERWLDVGKERKTRVAIRFGKKANKSPALAAQCARLSASGQDVGLDVASCEEFRAALSAGNRGEQLIVTGPSHPEPLIRLASQHRASLTVATRSDFERAARVTAPNKLDVFVRLRTDPQSRFGLAAPDLRELLIAPDTASNRLRIRGISYHCSGYTITERLTALHNALHLVAIGRAAGHPIDTISAGGGWPVNYVAPAGDSTPAQTWDKFQQALLPQNFFTGGVPDVSYPYGLDPSGPEAFDAYLGDKACMELRRRGLRLMIEPGRALCAGAGVSIFPVLSTQDHPDRGPRVGVTVVDGTSLSLSEQWFGSEFYPDPLLFDHQAILVGQSTEESYGTAVAGRTCLDSDFLSRRYVPLPRRPREGDLLVYPDTAGYQMDSNESTFHDIPTPSKYFVDGPLENPYLKEDT